MKDSVLLRCLSIVGGIVLLITAAITGADGDLRISAAALIAFGVGAGIGSALTARAAVSAVIKAGEKP